MSIIIKSGSSGFTANVDALGNLTTLTTPAAASDVAAPWTSATLVNTAQVLMSTGGYPAILLQLNQTSTITGGVVTYEGTFDSINWITLPSTFVFDPLTLAASPNPYTLAANVNHSVLLQTGGFQQVRARLSTAISGTGSVTLYWTSQSQSPLASSGSTTITGTLSSNIAQIGGTPIVIGQALMAASMPVVIASDQSPIPVTVPGTIPVTQSTSPWVVSGTVTADQGTSPWVISGSVGSPGVLDPNNSSTVTLGANASFVGVATDLLPYVSVRVIVFSDQNSAANGLMVEFSEDGTNWDISEAITITGGSGLSAPFGREARYFRVVYTNGTTPQGSFRLQSILQPLAWQGERNASVNITQIGDTDISLGQTVSASSFPVVIASDQSPIPVTLTSTTITGTVAVTQSTSPWVVSGTVTSNIGTTGGLALDATLTGGTQVTKLADAGGVNQAAISATGVLSVDGSSVIQPVSGTVAVSTVTSITNPVTVNQGTTPWVTDDANAVAQGTLLTGVNGFLQMGSVTTAAPSYTNGEISPLSLDPSGNLRVAIEGSIIASNNITEWNSVALGSPSAYGTSPGAVNVIGVNAFVTNTVTISGTVTANAGTGNFTVVQATASNLNATVVGTGTFAVQATQSGTWNIGTLTTITNPVTVVGDSASGAAKAGNPVQVGGVFNTTQPTVTTGQTVEAQSTARGAQIVATGVDTFNVTVNAALPAGTNQIGHVITDTGSTTAITGTVAVTQSTSPWVVSLTSTTITGTVSVTQGTTPWTVAGDVASGSANAGNPVKGGAVFNTTQPTVTNAQVVDNQATARGGLIVATGVDAFNVANAGTFAVQATQSGTWTSTVTQATASNLNATVVGTGTFAVQAAQSGTWNIGTLTTITNPVTVVGDAASGTAKAGNPVQGGAVFNTTQPTVTTGQVVENQASARGGLIVATGVDAFNVTLASTTITGTVAVTQSTSPWVVSGTVTANAGTGNFTVVQATASNLNATVVGTGTFAVQAAQSGTWTVQQGGAPWSQNLTQVAGTSLGATAVTNFGTAPAAAAVPGVNASLFAGTTGITATGSSLNVNVTNTVPVTLTSTTITGTVAVTQSTSPWVVNTTQWASTVLGTPQTFGTAPTGVVIGTSSDIYVAGTRARSNQTTTAAGVMDVNIVGSLGTTNSVTNGTFIAITDNTTKAGVIAGTTALKTDWSSQAGTAITTVPVAFGTGTPSGNAPGVNAALYVGTTPVRSNQTTTATGAVDNNLVGIKGTTVVTAAAGVQQVGLVGNTAATLDSANTAATAPTNALLTSAMYNSTVPTLTNGQAVAAECDTTGSLYSNPEGRKQTYRVGVIAFTPIASGTAPAISVTGSATKTIRITRIRVSITAGTGTAADISLKRFTALSGGTANSQSTNIAKMDSNNASATAVINQWSVAATTATAAGIVNAERYEIITAAVSVLPGIIEWTFGDKQGQSLVLRGTSEFAGFLISAVGTTPVADCWVEWTEE